MLLYWLIRFVRWLRWLLVMPTARDIARIDPNAPCPVCGTPIGRLRSVERKTGEGKSVTLCQHTCGACGARVFEAPILKVTPDMVHPAIARDDVEREEDRQQIVAAFNAAQAEIEAQRAQALAAQQVAQAQQAAQGRKVN